MQKVISSLLIAFFMAFAGSAVAASGTDRLLSLSGVDSGTQQSPAPPDCKKDPTDPRCKK